MEVTEKCDVYCFGIVTLEIIMEDIQEMFLIFIIRGVIVILICITYSENANFGRSGPTHLATYC
ncbi:Leucine-rich repeat receptor-like protein kinase family protein [Prunus dulcis]|uniref:Leucine-rich repeat receptor-like protein kinase family protein n=1 Tax=Prunus dulcis TaxID=3755 RepID=A0A4Y1RZG7_PRUDU|nr:Leucine-rich repeat receptor-like protein kinase family protein [Prunus dulcis]